MRRRYQISKERAVQRFKAAAQESRAEIQLALPLLEVLALAGQGLMKLALATFIKLAEEMMRWEAGELVGAKSEAQKERTEMRWGAQPGYCMADGQKKAQLNRPRVRDTRKREVPLGSYGLLQRSSLMEELVWQKIVHGLTTRGYSEVVRELKENYAVEKSTVSEYFIEGSRQRLQKLETRDLAGYAFCALFLEGTCFQKQHLIVGELSAAMPKSETVALRHPIVPVADGLTR